MRKKIELIIFDFGGTLDTNGIHWAEKFWEVYNHFQIFIPKEIFRNAFVYSERKISGIIKSDFSLLKTYQTQITYQLEYLEDNDFFTNVEESLVNKLSQYCYQSTMKNVNATKKVLEKLNDNFELGLVSNYYGNVRTVLTELGLVQYFSVIVDSTVVGIRKPDSKIFEIILNQLKIKASGVIVVGDSYKNDITPSQLLGCKTIWLKVKGWIESDDTKNADIIIASINDLPQAIDNLQELIS